MAEIDRTVEVISSLPLRHVDEDWVKKVWDGDFLEIDELSEETVEEFQSNSFYSPQLEDFKKLLSDWLVQKEVNTGEGFWTVLVENDVSIKTVLTVLAYFIDTGSKLTANANQRAAAILSATCYFKLVTIPGSGAFKVYSPELFIKAVDVLKIWSRLGTCKRKRSSSSGNSSHNQTSGRGRKKGRGNKRGKRSTAQEPTLNISEFPEDDDEEEGVEDEDLTPRQLTCFQNWMKGLLEGLVDLLETFSLKASESTAHHAIMMMAEITRMDGDRISTQFETWPRVMSPACLAYKGLIAMCSALHGHVISMTTAIFKYLLQNVLMLIGNNKAVCAQTIPRPVLNTRDNAVDFIRFVKKQGDERVIPPYTHLIQHLCTKVPDKSEYRTKVAQIITTLLDDLPDQAYVKMMEWIKRLSRHQKINNRVIALDVVSLVLASAERHLNEDLPADQTVFASHRFLVILLISRCSDIAPTVRTRAITAFANLLTTGDRGIISTLREMVTPKLGPRQGPLPRVIPTPGVEVRTVPQTEPSPRGGNVDETVEAEGSTAEKTAEGVVVDSQVKTPFNLIELTPGFNANLADDDGVISMLRRRSHDPKVNVRKAALQALECMIKFEAPDYRKEDLKILEERCSDPSLSVRKQAMTCLTDLLWLYPTDTKLHSVWLDGVLPLVMDRETTLQDKCIEVLEEIILHNIAPFERSHEESHRLVWSLLDIMTKYESLDLRRYLQRACQHWSRQGKLKKSLFNHLQTHMGTVNNKGAWLLLAEIATSFPKMDNEFLLKYWDTHCGENWGEDEKSTWPQVIAVIGCLAKNIAAEKRNEIAEELKSRLKRFDLSPQLIAVIINTLSKLCEAGTDEGASRRERESWCGCLLNACDEYLSNIILNEEASSIEDQQEDTIVRYLFTLGEIAQLCPAKTPKRVFMLVQSLIATPCITEDSGCLTELQTQVECPSSQATTVFSQPLSQFRGSKMSSKIRAHAFITLGKLCLQNENLAKKCIAALARELETSNDPSIRNNVIIIMCDLCVRYTTLVDRYVSNIAACLKDPSPLVRKQTLTLMTRLLQEDFLKWKGVLFYRYITTLLDENIQIRDFAEFCLVHLLLQRQPAMFFQHFVECVFHFNSYQEHTMYNKFTQSDREKQMFSLQGKQNSQKRLKLYLFMLEHMTDEHRFQLTAKLCQEVLGGAVDGAIPLEGESTALIEDALAILGSKEIKLSSMKVRPHEDVAEEQDMAAVVMATAKKTLITQVLKKNVIENIVPIVTSLKKMLEKKRSPVIRYLMLYLRELMKDYKNEVKEILALDKQLATEIEFDLRKFEEQQAEAEKQRQTTTPVNRNIQGRVSMSPAQGTPRSKQSPKPATPGAAANSPVLQIHNKSPSQSPAAKSPVAGVTSPRTPGSQGNLGSPKTPDRPGTPARGTPLSTLAILNSARKAMTRNTKLREDRNSPKPQEKTKSARKDRERRGSAVKWADKDGGDLAEANSKPEENSENMKTPPRRTRQSNRAISTPSAHLVSEDVLSNITFAGEQNITLIPPSPIPTSVPVRVYPVGDEVSPNSPTPKGKNAPDNLVYMFSPDKPAPKPKPWNVKPLSKIGMKLAAGDSTPPIDEEGETTLVADTSVSTRSRRQRAPVANTSTRRSSRTKR